ncbi:hypothetical protein OEZ86_004953 [Tetradesmus obliquus]|nr:hypothetical protein OEZ86_004953 [Tetradesmus obliquus]
MYNVSLMADRAIVGRQTHKLLLLRQQQQQQHCRPVLRRQRSTTVCRYDLRKSANNVEERRARQVLPGTSAAERALTPQQLKEAKATLAYQRAYALCGASSGRLSHQLCLFLLTEQPQLLAVNTDLLAGRIASLADVLGLSQPDAAELLLRSGALLDVLPLRLKSTAEALEAALGVSRRQALAMLAGDLSLLDTPPLRLKQQLEVLAGLLQVPFEVLSGMACSCPHLARVEPPAVQIRWASLQALLQLSSAELEALLQQEPRLLMPSSLTLSQNHSAAVEALNISAATFNSWVCAAPLLLLVPAAQLQNRAGALARILAEQAYDNGVAPFLPGNGSGECQRLGSGCAALVPDECCAGAAAADVPPGVPDYVS